jgi:hypothetical protein
METQAWRRCSFDYPERVPSMISPEEKQYLYWLGSRVWSGRGCVVEFGPWLGGSTVCLAAGMRASGHDPSAQLAVFDNFIWREFMAERADVPVEPGASFEAHFLENTGDYRDIIVSRVRALPDETISGDRDAERRRFAESEPVPLFDGGLERPVEILFVDGAKSWRGMRHLLCMLGDSFLDRGSLLVCQDFKHWGAYWVPAMMMRIGDFIRPVHDVLSATTVAFELTRRIPRQLLDELEDHVALLPTRQTMDAIERAASILGDAGDGAGAHRVRLGRVRFLAHQDRLSDAVAAFREVEDAWPVGESSEPLDRARAYLRDEKGVALPRPARLDAGETLRERLRRLGRRLLGPRSRPS